MTRWLPVLLLVGLSCGSSPVRTTTRNLNRPGPAAMICAGVDETSGAITGRPLAECRYDADTADTTRWSMPLFGLVANTGRGDVALFSATGTDTRGRSVEPLLDLDGGAGFGFIPVGPSPADLAATADGCRAVTTNGGSCDLAVIDVPAALTQACRVPVNKQGGLRHLCPDVTTVPGAAGPVVSRIVPHTAEGPLLARPQDVRVVFAPGQAAVEGQCPAVAAYRAYVTFPDCGLIAEIDLSTGLILQGLIATADGYTMTDTPRCEAECALHPSSVGSSADAASAVDAGLAVDVGVALDAGVSADVGTSLDAAVDDAGSLQDSGVTPVADGASSVDGGGVADAAGTSDAVDTGAVTSGGPRPYGLALLAGDSGSRLFISSAGANFITVLPLGVDGLFGTPRRIALEGSDAATTRLVVSPPNADLGQFIYAVAADRSVRVVSLDLEQECETNVDLATLPDTVPLTQARCFPVADHPARRASASGPGLSLGLRVPRDVAFLTALPTDFDAGTVESPPTATPLRGLFAMVAFSDGTLLVVDLQDTQVIASGQAEVSKLSLPHHVRNSLQGTTDGETSVRVATVSDTSGGGVPVVVSTLDGVDLEGQGIALRSPASPVSTAWSVEYEGSLIERLAGQVELRRDGLFLSDRGADFCAAGVLGRDEVDGRPLRHGDIVVLAGCSKDDECGVDQVCRRPVAAQTSGGLCLDKDLQDQLFQACAPWLRGEREFLVKQSFTGELQLDVLPTEPQRVILQSPQPDSSCTSNEDCAAYYLCALADHVVDGQPELSVEKGQCFRSGCDPDSAEDSVCPNGKLCVRPLDGSPAVCTTVPPPIEPWPLDRAQSCSSDADCADLPDETGAVSGAGWVCAAFAGAGSRCVRASACFGQLQHYQLRAGRSFVVGSYRRVTSDATTAECRIDTTRDPLLVTRVPVGLPIYPVLLGPVCEREPGPFDVPQPNPCFLRDDHSYEGFSDKASEVAAATATGAAPSTRVYYANPDIAFSLGLSHLADVVSPTVSTDGVSSVVGQMPARGLTISLEVQNGYAYFVPSSSTLVFSLPSRLLVSPDESLYVVDGGDTSGTSGDFGKIQRLTHSDETVDSYIVR